MPIVKLRVDFGDPSDDHLLPARVTSDDVAPETAVILFDGEGNMCGGTVDRVDGRIAWVRPNWGTWVPSVMPSLGRNTGRAYWASSTGDLGTGQAQGVHADTFRSAVPA